MSRQRYCRLCNSWHETDNWPDTCIPVNSSKSTLASPMIIADTMAPVQSQLDGKMYDSKAALRATYKAAGVVEVGNDSSVTGPKARPKPKADRKAIAESVGKALSRAGLGA